jgi:hypothetical protein
MEVVRAASNAATGFARVVRAARATGERQHRLPTAASRARVPMVMLGPQALSAPEPRARVAVPLVKPRRAPAQNMADRSLRAVRCQTPAVREQRRPVRGQRAVPAPSEAVRGRRRHSRDSCSGSTLAPESRRRLHPWINASKRGEIVRATETTRFNPSLPCNRPSLWMQRMVSRLSNSGGRSTS